MQLKIKGFENYTIDENGTVVNLMTGKTKIPCSNYKGRGYLYVDLYKNGKSYKRYLHRLVAETFIPNPHNKPYVNHKDGNTHNNSIENLEWCTPLENVEHASKVLGVMTCYNDSNYKKHEAQ